MAQGIDFSKGERYQPGIWVDPDGCEHWVMDDGVEGYMDLKRDRDGRPTCHKVSACAVMAGDSLFASGSAAIGPAERARLAAFFRDERAAAYTVIGHTDSRGPDAANLALSMARARAVAEVARSVGGNVSEVRGMGERQPVASNATAAGMAANRRVEIICAR